MVLGVRLATHWSTEGKDRTAETFQAISIIHTLVSKYNHSGKEHWFTVTFKITGNKVLKRQTFPLFCSIVMSDSERSFEAMKKYIIEKSCTLFLNNLQFR